LCSTPFLKKEEIKGERGRLPIDALVNTLFEKGRGQSREREGGCQSMHWLTPFLKKEEAEGGREREATNQCISQHPF